mmetsp:Transcript_4523/g.11574  ORF Transcript_4523/g.11574 Transcript_4523/m.11574 type:complete len:567 (-) Transcript_4523:8-1708(-)
MASPNATVLIAITILGDPPWPDGVIPPPAKENPGYLEDARPLWLQTALAANRNAAQRFGHTLDVKQLPGPPFLKAQREYCDTKPPDQPSGPFHRRNCYRGAHRNNCTWYKFRQILQYLLDGVAEYVLFVDCDAFIMLRQDHDPVGRMVDTMNAKGVDIMVADEDWRGANGQTNTGVVLARNCEWTKAFLTDILKMQEDNVCKTNEQACFRMLVGQDYKGAAQHVFVGSGLQWNRHPTDRRDKNNVRLDWDTNALTEIVHFMGGAKPGLERIDVADNGVCNLTPLQATPTAAAGFRPACIDVDHCASAALVRSKGGDAKARRAFVLAEPLASPPGQRFLNVAAMRAALDMATQCGADTVIVVPRAGVAKFPLTAAERAVLKTHAIQVHEVPWIYPPGVAAATATAACDDAGFLSLHALGLTMYESVVALGPGVRVRRNACGLFGCSADPTKGRFLHAGAHGATHMAAVRPHAALLEAVVKAVAGLGWPATGALNRTDCGLAAAATVLCDARHDAAVSAVVGAAKAHRPHCHAVDPCKWGRGPGDDAVCSAIGLPCALSRIAAGGACK